MDEEFDKKLVETFPELYWQRYLPMDQTAMCWGFDTQIGWNSLIWELSEKLAPLVKAFNEEMDEKFKELPKEDQEYYKDGSPYKFGVVQVKEKFGGLRYYVGLGNNEIFSLIHEYEDKSYTICEFCGEPGETRDMPWITTLCDKHYQEYLDRNKNKE